MERFDRPRLRRLLLDVPLGLLIGLLCLGAGVMSRWAATTRSGRPFGRDGRGFGSPERGLGALPDPSTLLSSTSWALLIGCAVLLAASVAFRRQYPRIAYLVAIAAGSGYLLGGFPIGPVLAAPALTLLALASSRPTRRWIWWTALLLPFLWSGFVRRPGLGLADPDLYQALIFGSALTILPALVGLIRRTREQAQQRTRELELRRSAYQERLRIARDVHDVVGHSLSVISMQAGVALHLLETRPEQAQVSLQAIRDSSKNALTELRSTLAVFRDESYDTEHRPTAGLDGLPELVGAFEAGGRHVTVIGAGDLGARSAAVDLAGYRIVQEALTNIARHTRDADGRIELRRIEDRLQLMIDNDGPVVRMPAEHDGTGIAGMAERARSVGGSLTAGPRPEGGFLVRAWLPGSPANGQPR